MKKHGENLFQIGEVTKILGVTRKAILVYENMGLLTPAVKDEKSGFRYYTMDNLAQIRSIRSLQSLGLSLKEVAEYYMTRKTWITICSGCRSSGRDWIETSRCFGCDP